MGLHPYCARCNKPCILKPGQPVLCDSCLLIEVHADIDRACQVTIALTAVHSVPTAADSEPEQKLFNRVRAEALATAGLIVDLRDLEMRIAERMRNALPHVPLSFK